MTEPSDTFDALRLPVVPLAPRPALVTDLRARLHRRLGLDDAPEFVPMRKAVGLEYEIGGREDGAAVLFMHAGTATAYLPLMHEPALAERYRLVRYHRRGYAGSDGFDGEVSIGRHVEDALALMDHLAIERVHLVGHSGSGVIALQVALDAPGRVRSLVLEEPAMSAIDPRWRDMMRDATAPPVERYRAGDPRGAMEMWMRGLSQSWRADLIRTVPGGPQQTLEDAAAFFADVDLVDDWQFDHDRIERLETPVLYVFGDRYRRHAVLRRFQQIVPQTETALIPNASHMLHTDQPELVATELGAFFARHADRI
jgi:pimeloyl-ACP methyl ester carboxylesterase